MITDSELRRRRSRQVLMAVLVVMGIPLMFGSSLSPSTSPTVTSQYVPPTATYEKCMDPNSVTAKMSLEKEYTGERPKGSHEAFCRNLDEAMSTIREQERKRREFRSQNP
jgi:hypothetical protein